MPDAHDRALLFDGGVVGVDDVRAPLEPHGPAHQGPVGGKGVGAKAVNGSARGEHTGAVALVQQLDAAVVEEPAKPRQWNAWVERLIDYLRGQGRHRNSPRLIAVRGGGVSSGQRSTPRWPRRTRKSC